MEGQQDATADMKRAASELPDVVTGSSCNQTSFKAGKNAFLYVGPGRKGRGYKAMFNLNASMGEAKDLEKRDPERYEIGIGNWVTVRFSNEAPLSEDIWGRWLRESYALATKKGSARKRSSGK